MSAPKVRFMTKIYHPNIDKLGRICLDILKGMSFFKFNLSFRRYETPPLCDLLPFKISNDNDLCFIYSLLMKQNFLNNFLCCLLC